MKRRQMLTLWSALAGFPGLRAAAGSPCIGKQSTRSEVSEYARGNDSDLGGLAPESHPDESENCQQTQECQRRAPAIEKRGHLVFF